MKNVISLAEFESLSESLSIEQPQSPSLSELGIDSVFDLETAAHQPDEWMLSDLIERGDQVLIAGAPKTGKSLLAMQIGLAVSAGGNVLKWRSPKPRKVLYINLEIRRKWFARRVERQIAAEKKEEYFQFFSCSISTSIDVLSESDFHLLRRRIGAIEPDLLIFDVFSRMHCADEIDPRAMRDVMLRIRDAAGGAAHLIVIHTRKPDMKASGPQTAADIKGTVSIFGECDTAIVLSKFVQADEQRLALHIEARNVGGAFCHLGFDVQSLTFLESTAVSPSSQPSTQQKKKRGSNDDEWD